VKVQAPDTAEFTRNKLYQKYKVPDGKTPESCWRRLYTKEPKTFLDRTSTLLVCRYIYLCLII